MSRRQLEGWATRKPRQGAASELRSDQKETLSPCGLCRRHQRRMCAKIALICIIRRAEFGRSFNDARCIAQSCNLKVSPTPPSTQATQDARIAGASYVKRGPGWTLVNSPGRQVANRQNPFPGDPSFSSLARDLTNSAVRCHLIKGRH